MPTMSVTSCRPAAGLLANNFLRKQAPEPNFWDEQTGLAGNVVSFPQDQAIYGEGDDAVLFFKIVSGVVRTCKYLGDGRRQIDAFYVAGDVFGIEPAETYRLSAEAVCGCTLIAYRRRGLETLNGKDEATAKYLFQFALQNAARAQDHALLLGRRSAVEKLAAFLLDWARHSAQLGTVTLEMSRQDIADFLGLTIETVSRTLSKLEKDSVIKLSAARSIQLRNLAMLRALGD